MDEETQTPESEEEIEVEVIEEKETKEPKTEVTRPKIEGQDFCPFCNSEKIAKDFKQNVYVCQKCGRGWKIVG